MKKTAAILAISFIIFISIIALLAWHSISAPWPQTKGELTIPGLHEQVTVIRDKRGVPHIYAHNPHDLFMAQGYVHAQDRFWQMEFWRRVGAGKLSEIFGESQLKTDRFLRTLGTVSAAERSWEALDETTKAGLEAYAAGVNAYLTQHNEHLPMEFQILSLTGVRYTPAPWTPTDTLTWATMMSLDLGRNYKSELLRAQLLDRYGLTWMNELTNYPYNEKRPIIVPDGVAWNHLGLEATLAAIPEDGLILGSGSGVGSNNWVVAGDHTTTGKPLLANDPHLGIQMPAIWYENGLHCQPVNEECPYDVVGFSFATTPGIIIGHNQRIAWGVTNAPTDVQDLYIERINPQNPNQYEVDGQWVDMEIRQETINVAGRDEPEIITIRSTRHGPIINDVAYGPGSDWTYGWQPLALQWTAIGTNRLVQAILGINRAGDWQSFRQALHYWDAPSQNFVYADIDGNIGYQMPGLIPIRAQGDGTLPVPGWNDDYAWTGFIPFDELPTLYNPPQGYIITANNKITGPAYPYFIGNEWPPGYRAQRIQELITAKKQLTITDFQHIQGDNANLLAREIIPLLAKVSLQRTEVATMRDHLLQWDTQQDPDSAQALIFEDFYYHLFPDIFEDELEDTMTFNKRLVELMITQPDAHWWDNTKTPERETREDILTQALNETYDDLSKRSGKNMKNWRWGDQHTATFRNQTLGNSGIGIVEALFNRGPFETGGGNDIVNATSWSGKEPTPFEVVWLPSMRMIVDMADFSRSLSINTTGQSGHPYHKHYADQSQDWATIRYRPMHWERSQIEADAEGALILKPEP